jgi:hypothetical protein
MILTARTQKYIYKDANGCEPQRTLSHKLVGWMVTCQKYKRQPLMIMDCLYITYKQKQSGQAHTFGCSHCPSFPSYHSVVHP